MRVIVSGAEYLTLPRTPETWLVEGLLPVSGAMLLFGDSKVGKSFAALQLAGSLVQGGSWLGFRIPQPTRVVYIQLDTPRALWAERVQSLRGLALDQVYFADRETLNTYPFNILDPAHFTLLTSSLAELKPGVVIIDTLREAHRANENDASEMQGVISHLDAAVKPAAMMLVSHSRKSSPERGYDLMNDPRGSSYLVGRMDSIVRFTHSSMRCTSRVLEEYSTKLDRLDDGTWELLADPLAEAAEELIRSNPDTPLRELARTLHIQAGKSIPACRAYLRRLVAGRTTGTGRPTR